MFQIVSNLINFTDLEANPPPDVGAISIFKGTVRNVNEGKKVESLEYECYESMAVKEGLEIINKAKARFNLIDIRCQHRIGHLQIGDVAIMVVAFSRHRKDAMEACSWVVDEVKLKVPIWKKEHYVDGKAEWIFCPHCEVHREDDSHEALSLNENDYFKAQLNIKSIGESGLKKLKKSHITVIGVGGLGTVALENFARMGVGQLRLIDYDQVSVSNIARQTLFTTQDIGRTKVDTAFSVLKNINPWVEITTVNQKLDFENIKTLLLDTDIVVDCTDNFTTKFLIHDFCHKEKKDLVQSSVFQFEGRLNNFFFSENKKTCLRCLYPDTPSNFCADSCSESGILASTVNIFGTLQANEVLKRILRKPGIPQGRTWVWDLESMEPHSIKWKNNPDCKLCGDNVGGGELPHERVLFTDTIGVGDVVIATDDVQTDLFKVELRFDISDYLYTDWKEKIDPDKRYVVVCQRGFRSYELVRHLQKLEIRNVYSLKNGMESFLNKAHH